MTIATPRNTSNSHLTLFVLRLRTVKRDTANRFWKFIYLAATHGIQERNSADTVYSEDLILVKPIHERAFVQGHFPGFGIALLQMPEGLEMLANQIEFVTGDIEPNQWRIRR